MQTSLVFLTELAADDYPKANIFVRRRFSGRHVSENNEIEIPEIKFLEIYLMETWLIETFDVGVNN